MILIRGYSEESHARDIEKDIIGFQDMFTTLLYPSKTGYCLLYGGLIDGEKVENIIRF